MKDVVFEIEGNPELLRDDGVKRKLTYEGYYITGRGDKTVVIVTHYCEDDDGDDIAVTIPINYRVYVALKEAFEEDAFDEPGGETTFNIREPINP